MATDTKTLQKQASRQELLEAFKLFDVDGDGEVVNFEVVKQIYLNPLRFKSHIYNDYLITTFPYIGYH